MGDDLLEGLPMGGRAPVADPLKMVGGLGLIGETEMGLVLGGSIRPDIKKAAPRYQRLQRDGHVNIDICACALGFNEKLKLAQPRRVTLAALRPSGSSTATLRSR